MREIVSFFLLVCGVLEFGMNAFRSQYWLFGGGFVGLFFFFGVLLFDELLTNST